MRQIAIAPPEMIANPDRVAPTATRRELAQQADALLKEDKKKEKSKKGEGYVSGMDVLHYAAKPVPLEGGKVEIQVNVMSYEGGPRKIQLIKAGIQKDWKVTNIPRLTLQETKALWHSLAEAVQWMEAN
jgi:hypothetical protein